MHELGIVFHVAKQVEKVAAENDVNHICEVVLEVGEVSTVIPEYLYDCWDWHVKKSEILCGAKLTCETIHALTFCEGCRTEYDTLAHGKTCPNCGSTDTYLVTGDEVLIKEVVADEH